MYICIYINMYIDIYVYIYIPNKKPELVNMPSSK